MINEPTMKSIYDHFSELMENQWNYYEGNELKGRKPFSGDISHKEFIEQYLKDGEKSFVYDEFKSIISNFTRFEHTNSVFFLGCVFFEKLDMKKYLTYFRDGNSINEFYFMWFLTSLIHDFSYEFESAFDKYSDNIKDIESLKIYKGITNDLLDDKLHDIDSKTFKLLRNVKQYFDYRIHESRKIDHGIMGGLLLFDLLEKNRLNRLEQQEGVESNNLCWNEKVKAMYIQACSAIATHNIWKASEEDKEIYIKYGLADLIDTSIYPVSIADTPYLFLLGLIDSIDPVKIFHCVDAEYVLKNLLIDFVQEDTIVIKNEEGSLLLFSELIKKANTLDAWLNVTLDRIDDILTIKIGENCE